MKKNSGIILSFTLALAAMAPLAYAEGAAATPAATVQTPDIKTAEGTVSALDAVSIKVKSAAGTESAVAIDPIASTTWKGGSKVAFSSVKAGDKVKVRYTEAGGKSIAKTVEIG